MLLAFSCLVAAFAPPAPGLTSTMLPAGPTRAGASGGNIIMMSQPTKAQKLVRERLNPRANIEVMTESQLRKYAYAMQIEMQRLIREETSANELRESLRVLLDGANSGAVEVDAVDEGNLVGAMKMEGLVRYGLVYATAQTSWDKVRANHAEFGEMSDDELYAAFKSTGRGISETFGALF